MLPNEITELGWPDARPPLPVGRSYARRVLFTVEGVIPMSAVDMGEVRKHCRIALLQTVIRDVLAIGFLAASALLEPWGTTVTFGLVTAFIILVGRVRLFSPLIIAVAMGAALAVVTGTPNERISFAVPLISLAACLFIYLADMLLSIYYVRKIWRRASLPPLEPQETARRRLFRLRRGRSPRAPEFSGDTETAAGGLYPRANGRRSGGSDGRAGSSDWSAGQADLDGRASGHGVPKTGGSVRVPSVSRPSRVYYDKQGIVGAGVAQVPLTLTVPLGKPRDKESQIAEFSTSDLIGYIGVHLLSQSAGDESVHGLAYRPLSSNGVGESTFETGHFTYGLPYLDVGTVVAIPVPNAKKISPARRAVLPLLYHVEPSADEILGVTNRSPSEHPDRHYMRATTASWDGQLVASVFLNAALQGHFLRVIIRPYALAPIVSDLKIADQLAARNPVILTCMATVMTVRQARMAVARLHGLRIKPDKSGKAYAPRPGLLSTRELYAQLLTENMHQREDLRRVLQVLQEKIVQVTMDFLREHNIDIDEYEKNVLTSIYNNTIFGDGVISTGDNSQVNNNKGNGNYQNNTKNS
jgi:hypothetical protein